jgi:modulator of FtsH protease
VNAAYSAVGWDAFGTAVATAAAALAGLLFIAVSINLAAILQGPNLPGRAALTLIMLATPLVSSVLLLIPGQGRVPLGAELLACGLVVGGGQAVINAKTPTSEEEPKYAKFVGRLVPLIVIYGSLLVAGVTLLAQAGGGLFWLVPGALAAFAAGLINVWVLLIEILR